MRASKYGANTDAGTEVSETIRVTESLSLTTVLRARGRIQLVLRRREAAMSGNRAIMSWASG